VPSAGSYGAAEDETNTRTQPFVRTQPIGQLTEVLLFGEDVSAGTTSESLKEHRFSTTLAPTPASCPARRGQFGPKRKVEGTLTGEAGLRCQLAHRPQRDGFAG
jgi:hypothetical protein